MTRIMRILILAIVAIGMYGAAQASVYPYNIPNLTTYLNGNGGQYAAADYSAYTGALSGDYFVTAIAHEAGHVNHFVAGDGTVLFSNDDVSGSTYTAYGTYETTDMSTAYLLDTSSSTQYPLSSLPVAVVQLNQAWTVPTLGIDLAAGTLIIGLNDSWSGDKDFDDLILAAHPTPIPGAVWLLGSGLSGIVFLRRRFNV